MATLRTPDTLEKKIDGLADRIDALSGRIRTSNGVRALIVILLVGNAYGLTRVWADAHGRIHDQCKTSNRVRGEIKNAIGEAIRIAGATQARAEQFQTELDKRINSHQDC